MASIRSTLVLLSVCVLTSACQKSENLDQLSRGEFSVAPDTITVRVAEYCPTNGKTYKDLFVRNFSTKVIHGEIVLDSDADGLTDDVERQSAAPFNISPTLADTNMDFFSDFLVFTAGISITQQDYLRCAEGGNIDDDNEGTFYLGNYIGLNNCEESRLTLTDAQRFDTDNDSIPDYLELRCGLNPRNSNDALLDPDADGVPNIDECKMGTPIDESNLRRSVDKFAARYRLQTDAYNSPGCMQIEISNLPVLNGSGSNLIGLYLVETDGNRQLTIHTDWIEVTDGANGRIYMKDNWPDTDRSQVWRYVQPQN